ncbi:putative nuclease HARBI1 [Lytechinus variegatus]|uniref:putative nuclease HARBI1 n=1 Tax=Lytechinus variegatus TaxID=7654 RepID=UPI001BB1BBCF|nr:putative nuclease HARBI1 [Lytechinus variegatus]
MAAYIAELEEEEEQLQNVGRVFRDRLHPLDTYTDEEFYKKYRFSRHGATAIVDMVGDGLEHQTERNHALPASLQVLIALNFFATGAVLDSVGTIHGVHRSSVSRCVHSVADALCRHKNHVSNLIYLVSSTSDPLPTSFPCHADVWVIKFPKSDGAVVEAIEGFYRIAQFPRVVGAIDCTHVGLHGCPLGEDEYVYVNRKGKYTLNVQLVCDSNFVITNVIARWPGSTHDSRILQTSKLHRKFQNGQLKGILLGDSGYPLLPWLMTPILNPQSQAERAYNNSQVKSRAIIEQVNGRLKNKFRCLIGHGMQIRPERAERIITACCVLYNISKQYGERQDHDERDVEAHQDEIEEVVRQQGVRDLAAIAVRAEIVRTFDA